MSDFVSNDAMAAPFSKRLWSEAFEDEGCPHTKKALLELSNEKLYPTKPKRKLPLLQTVLIYEAMKHLPPETELEAPKDCCAECSRADKKLSTEKDQVASNACSADNTGVNKPGVQNIPSWPDLMDDIILNFCLDPSDYDDDDDDEENEKAGEEEKEPGDKIYTTLTPVKPADPSATESSESDNAAQDLLHYSSLEPSITSLVLGSFDTLSPLQPSVSPLEDMDTSDLYKENSEDGEYLQNLLDSSSGSGLSASYCKFLDPSSDLNMDIAQDPPTQPLAKPQPESPGAHGCVLFDELTQPLVQPGSSNAHGCVLRHESTNQPAAKVETTRSISPAQTSFDPALPSTSSAPGVPQSASKGTSAPKTCDPVLSSISLVPDNPQNSSSAEPSDTEVLQAMSDLNLKSNSPPTSPTHGAPTEDLRSRLGISEGEMELLALLFWPNMPQNVSLEELVRASPSTSQNHT